MNDERIEVTIAPESLWDNSVPVTRLALGGIGLGDSAGHVDPASVTSALPGRCPPGFVNWRIEGNNEFFLLRRKRVYHSRRERAERQAGTPWPLAERTRFIMARDGSLLTEYGHFYDVEGGAVTELGVYAAAVPQIASFSKRDIIERFGWPDYLWEYDQEGFGPVSTMLLYTRGLNIHFSDEGNRLVYLKVRQDITPYIRPEYAPYTGQPTRLLS